MIVSAGLQAAFEGFRHPSRKITSQNRKSSITFANSQLSIASMWKLASPTGSGAGHKHIRNPDN
jgi:hypothetical protein